MMLNIDNEKFKKMFPKLSDELSSSESVGSLVRKRKLPTIMDHIERCENDEEAMEIIDFFLKIGEIKEEDAEELKNNIKELRDLFGTRKRGDYERRGLNLR
ncbi:DUF2095 family protein [Archaeoglobus sulfaticallidus]|nr:DUF2095 family protein [Archaeoglobus sulfaticallidus]